MVDNCQTTVPGAEGFNPVSHQHHFFDNGRYTKSLRTSPSPFLYVNMDLSLVKGAQIDRMILNNNNYRGLMSAKFRKKPLPANYWSFCMCLLLTISGKLQANNVEHTAMRLSFNGQMSVASRGFVCNQSP
jgi:hypothetical protein